MVDEKEYLCRRELFAAQSQVVVQTVQRHRHHKDLSASGWLVNRELLYSVHTTEAPSQETHESRRIPSRDCESVRGVCQLGDDWQNCFAPAGFPSIPEGLIHMEPDGRR